MKNLFVILILILTTSLLGNNLAYSGSEQPKYSYSYFYKDYIVYAENDFQLTPTEVGRLKDSVYSNAEERIISNEVNYPGDGKWVIDDETYYYGCSAIDHDYKFMVGRIPDRIVRGCTGVVYLKFEKAN